MKEYASKSIQFDEILINIKKYIIIKNIGYLKFILRRL